MRERVKSVIENVERYALLSLEIIGQILLLIFTLHRMSYGAITFNKCHISLCIRFLVTKVLHTYFIPGLFFLLLLLLK